MTAVTHRAHPGTPYGGAAVGSPGYSGSLQTANGARGVNSEQNCIQLGLVRNKMFATTDTRFAALLSQYKKTGEISLSPQDPKNYADAIKKLAPLVDRIMVASKEQMVELEKRLKAERT